jgi:hypothetical protein
MNQRISFRVSIVMQRIAINNRWQPHKWQPASVLFDDGLRGNASSHSLLRETTEQMDVLWPGFVLDVFADEAEGYFLNLTSPTPCVFVMWREAGEDDASGMPFPHSVTLSYNEAARWMDAQEKVDHVPMPEPIMAALDQWVQKNYEPPKKKQRIRPKSFESKEGRYDSAMSSSQADASKEAPAKEITS